MTRKLLRHLATLLSLTLVLACGGDSSGPGGSSASVNGTYTLKTVNGAAMPVTLATAPGYSLRITSASFTVNANNTFSNTATFQETQGSATVSETETCSGTYTKNGNSLTFTESSAANSDCGGTYNGTWDGSNTLTVALDATVQAVFQR